MVTFSQMPAAAKGSARLKASTSARPGASIRNRLPIIVWPSSETSGPDITILTPKREVSLRKALWAS